MRARFARALQLAAALAAPARADPPPLLADRLPPRPVLGQARYAGRRVDLERARREGLLALTFDDGPSAQTTPDVLAALDRAGAPAAFFVNGYRLGGRSEAAEKQRALLLEEAGRGDAIGNHTFDHQRLSDLAPPAQLAEIVRGEASIARVLGERPFLFRPPYGRVAPAAGAALRQRNYSVILWNISSEDPYLRTPEKVLARVLDEIRREGGGVALFHDTHAWTAAALPRFFGLLAEENCRRVRAGEAPILLVPLDRLLDVRYGPDQPNGAEAAAHQAEADRAERTRIAAACGETEGKGGTDQVMK
jgi:peptidoglycan/xylan/chitin deacetylase (PgdA/CDA1 family)